MKSINSVLFHVLLLRLARNAPKYYFLNNSIVSLQIVELHQRCSSSTPSSPLISGRARIFFKVFYINYRRNIEGVTHKT